MKVVLAAIIMSAITWIGLWFTPAQQGQRLMDRGEFAAAAEVFTDPMRQGVAWFRAGEFKRAEQAFARVATPEAEYNRGNCLIFLGQYEAAVERFDQALAERPDWEDAQVNRSVAEARARLLERKGGDMGEQRIGADEIRFDRQGKGPEGQDTEVEQEAAMSDAAMQALWLRRVQTKPGDFLRSKFAYQLATGTAEEVPE